MTAAFVNDPTFDDVPAVGDGSVLVAARTVAGEAVRWAPGGDAVALAGYLGESHRAIDGVVYQVLAGGVLTPVSWLSSEVVVVKPPAGEVFTLGAAPLAQEFAIVAGEVSTKVVRTVEAEGGATVTGDLPALLADFTIPQLLEVVRKRGLPVSGSKSDLIDRLLGSTVPEHVVGPAVAPADDPLTPTVPVDGPVGTPQPAPAES